MASEKNANFFSHHFAMIETSDRLTSRDMMDMGYDFIFSFFSLHKVFCSVWFQVAMKNDSYDWSELDASPELLSLSCLIVDNTCQN